MTDHQLRKHFNSLDPDEKMLWITQRHIAKFLGYLEDTEQLTPKLRADVIRSFHYLLEDLQNTHGFWKDE